MSDDNVRIGSPAGRSADEPHIGKYRLIKTIGKGNFAKVKLAKHLPTGRQVILCLFCQKCSMAMLYSQFLDIYVDMYYVE